MGLFNPLWKSKNSDKRMLWINNKANINKSKHHKIIVEIALKDKDYYVRQCAYKKLIESGNQEPFAEVTENNKSTISITQSLNELTIPKIVFSGGVYINSDIAERDCKIRKAVVEKLTGQNLLANIAKNALDNDAGAAALERCNDLNVIADIAKNSRNILIRKTAVSKLTNQNILIYIAKNDLAYEVRITAVEKLTDMDVLQEIAKSDKDSFVRKTSVKKLSDQNVLVDIALNDNDFYVRKDAIEKLTDQNILADIAIQGKSAIVRIAAIKKLTNLEILIQIAKIEKDKDVYTEAVSKINNNGVLADFAKNCDEKFALIAIEKIDSWDQSVLNDISINAKNCRVRQKAFQKLGLENSQEALADIAKNDENPEIRIISIKKSTDQTLLEEIAKSDENSRVRREAIKKIANQNILIEIINKDSVISNRIIAFLNLSEPHYFFDTIIDELIKTDFLKYENNEELKIFIDECIQKYHSAYSLLLLIAIFYINFNQGKSSNLDDIRSSMIKTLQLRSPSYTFNIEEMRNDCKKTVESELGIELANTLLDCLYEKIITSYFWYAVDKILETAGDLSNFSSRLAHSFPEEYLKNPAILKPLKDGLLNIKLPNRFNLAFPEIIRKTELPEAKALLIDALKVDFYIESKIPELTLEFRVLAACNLRNWEVPESQQGIEHLCQELCGYFKSTKSSYHFYSIIECLTFFNKPKAAYYAVELLEDVSDAYKAYKIIENSLNSCIGELDEQTLMKINSLKDNIIGWVPTGYSTDCDGYDHPIHEKQKLDIKKFKKNVQKELTKRSAKN
jgi:hypothetical protein